MNNNVIDRLNALFKNLMESVTDIPSRNKIFTIHTEVNLPDVLPCTEIFGCDSKLAVSTWIKYRCENSPSFNSSMYSHLGKFRQESIDNLAGQDAETVAYYFTEVLKLTGAVFYCYENGVRSLNSYDAYTNAYNTIASTLSLITGAVWDDVVSRIDLRTASDLRKNMLPMLDGLSLIQSIDARLSNQNVGHWRGASHYASSAMNNILTGLNDVLDSYAPDNSMFAFYNEDNKIDVLKLIARIANEQQVVLIDKNLRVEFDKIANGTSTESDDNKMAITLNIIRHVFNPSKPAIVSSFLTNNNINSKKAQQSIRNMIDFTCLGASGYTHGLLMTTVKVIAQPRVHQDLQYTGWFQKQKLSSMFTEEYAAANPNKLVVLGNGFIDNQSAKGSTELGGMLMRLAVLSFMVTGKINYFKAVTDIYTSIDHKGMRDVYTRSLFGAADPLLQNESIISKFCSNTTIDPSFSDEMTTICMDFISNHIHGQVLSSLFKNKYVKEQILNDTNKIFKLSVATADRRLAQFIVKGMVSI